MGKKKTMQEKVEEGEALYEPGEQMDLIDVTPEELKKIRPVVKKYKQVVKSRVALTAEEVELKNKIKEFVHASELKRLPDGSIKFRCDGFLVEVTPRDEVVKVKEANDE